MPAMFSCIALLTLSTLNDFGEKTLFPQPRSVSSGFSKVYPSTKRLGFLGGILFITLLYFPEKCLS